MLNKSENNLRNTTTTDVNGETGSNHYRRRKKTPDCTAFHRNHKHGCWCPKISNLIEENLFLMWECIE
jgi:hypothetical protein